MRCPLVTRPADRQCKAGAVFHPPPASDQVEFCAAVRLSEPAESTGRGINPRLGMATTEEADLEVPLPSGFDHDCCQDNAGETRRVAPVGRYPQLADTREHRVAHLGQR